MGRVGSPGAAFATTPNGAHGVTRPTFKFVEREYPQGVDANRGIEPTPGISQEGSFVLCAHIANSPPGRGEGVGWFMGNTNVSLIELEV